MTGRTRTTPKAPDPADRGIVSDADLRRPGIRYGLRAVHGLLLAALLVTGLGPVLWLAKAAVTPTQDTLRTPLAVFPHGIDLANLAEAWTRFDIDLHFVNTLWLALGSWAVQLLVAVTGGYVLSVLRPWYARILNWLVLSTLFVPAVVLLVPLYLTVLDVPGLHVSLVNTFWAVWLPAGANAFNVLLVTRFFDGLPREVFEAARVDGAGPFRLGWSIVLPMSRPVLGVVSVLAFVTAWKDFLWPLLVLRDQAVQPLSVRLPALQDYVELEVLLAALAVSTVIPVLIFLLFQRLFLDGAGISGAVKG
ncbi:carbohydrate ABC transporter permease [Myceligenerans crystallogenes]|uniref:Carbohydrate ABC transporter permease n=1 Tax=Myceligenerans crystallogenes TaxID=316335 RepID=A0ABN2N6G4_9MICO